MAERLAGGVQPDAVGHMVLDAVREDRLYVYTDLYVVDLIQKRCKALLDAPPAEGMAARREWLRALPASGAVPAVFRRPNASLSPNYAPPLGSDRASRDSIPSAILMRGAGFAFPPPERLAA